MHFLQRYYLVLLSIFLIGIIGILLVTLFRVPSVPPAQTPTPSPTTVAAQLVATNTPVVEQLPAETATVLLTVTSTLSSTLTSSPPTLVDTLTPDETPTPLPIFTATATESPTTSSTSTPTVISTDMPMAMATPTNLVSRTPQIPITTTTNITATPIVTVGVKATIPCTDASYTVRSGDTLTNIAFRFGVDPAAIMAANHIVDGDTLLIGKVLLIPCPQPPLNNNASPDAVKTTVMPQLLGHSTGGWPIEVFQFGSGPLHLVLIGGIHGGYEWNTILLAYAAIDYFSAHPEAISSAITLYIVPTANPDGLVQLIGQPGRFTPNQIPMDPIPGRFNTNQVDLNRNWDCHWQAQGVWGNRPVSAGQAPFSEVETQVLRTFLTNPPAAGVLFWHSAQHGVFAGSCNSRLATGDELASVYAAASGYPFLTSFDSYNVTGDAADWLAQQGIPAIEVELTNHTNIEWDKNLRAMLALIQHFAKLANIN